MSLAVIDGFDNRSNNSLDANYIVANVAALSVFRFLHKGMCRWVEDQQDVYVLQNDLVTWKPLGTGKVIKWVAGTYKINQLAIYGAGLYESQKDNNTSIPGANADWLKIVAAKGDKGDTGTSGKSAYQLWLLNGNTGSLLDFFNSLKGPKGDTGDSGTFNMTEVIAAAPTLADEAAAITAGLLSYTLYKTATGELRYKLPIDDDSGFPYTLPITFI